MLTFKIAPAYNTLQEVKMRFLKYVLILTLLLLITIAGILALLYWDYQGVAISKSNNLFEQVSRSSCHEQAQDVHIAYITDENYLYPTQVSAFSAIRNKCPNSTYYFHIITVSVDSKQAESFFHPLTRANVHFEIIPQNEHLNQKFPELLKHISFAALLKLDLPEILTNLDRVIFLDSDTLVTKDLQELFTTDLQDFVMGAVSDIGIIAQAEYLKNLNYKQPVYYNAGMLLMDLKKMREEKLCAQFKNYLQNAKGLVFLEQDTLNMVLQNKIKALPYKYNCTAILYMQRGNLSTFWGYLKQRLFSGSKYTSNFFKLYKSELPFLWRNVFKETVIFHYFGPSKPWNTAPTPNIPQQLYANLWHKYANQLDRLKKE